MSTTSLPRRALKLASRLSDTVHPPERGITVLVYHRVGAGRGGQMDLGRGAFEQQIAWLRSQCRILDLASAVAEVTGAGPVDPGVVLTFDDGTADWVDTVAPILVEHDVPATFYLTTGYPEGDQALPDGATPLSWAGVRELHSTGLATIASHTHSHLLLDRLAPDDIADELDRSIELIGHHVGSSPAHFAYPKAVPPSRPAHVAVVRRFRSAALAGTRANGAGVDPYLLARSPIQAADTFDDFRRKAEGGMGLEDGIRQQLNRLRYRALRS